MAMHFLLVNTGYCRKGIFAALFKEDSNKSDAEHDRQHQFVYKGSRNSTDYVLQFTDADWPNSVCFKANDRMDSEQTA